MNPGISYTPEQWATLTVVMCMKGCHMPMHQVHNTFKLVTGVFEHVCAHKVVPERCKVGTPAYEYAPGSQPEAPAMTVPPADP